ncbi:hypothetical protein DERF_011934 [Dermatophagoides farinae]|uniref:Uncharacterized protein n=1 Tax=Dermatophagoides farinae TaxID=6954 RepID=A0A922L190_DERFA|nr:hypothetical protein DERF_011934 [Dermatophagoides farinae]
MSPILNIIIRNLDFSFMRRNDNVSIMEMLSDDFILLKLYSFRMHFLLADYRDHRIKKTYETFKPSIWITIHSWTFILLITSIVIWPENDFIMDCKFYEQMLNVQRFDLIMLEIIVLSLIEEWLWLFFSKEAITYSCRYLDFLAFDLSEDRTKIDLKMKRYLIRYHSIMKFITTLIYFTVILWSMFLCIMLLYSIFFSYLDDNIYFIQFITSIPISILICTNIIYMSGQFFISGTFFLFFLILFREKIKQLKNLSSTLLQYHANVSQYIVKRIFWNQFYFEYIILYGKISRLNESAKVILLAMEMIAKSAIMMSCVFYSQQIKMVESNIFLVAILIIVFLYINIMYLRISILPTYNEQCLQSILRWLIRSQWRERFSVVQPKQSTFHDHIVQRIHWRQTLKSNLFIQAMANNRLGFTCGHMFHINKYKFTELILLNIPFVLMLYKHVSR